MQDPQKRIRCSGELDEGARALCATCGGTGHITEARGKLGLLYLDCPVCEGVNMAGEFVRDEIASAERIVSRLF